MTISTLVLLYLRIYGITATGTLRINRQGVPEELIHMKASLQGNCIPRGTGFYFREPNSAEVYVCYYKAVQQIYGGCG